MEMDILSVLEHKFPSFSKGQRTIAQFILKNYDKAAFMTAARLGEVTGVSESTVVRFAADLGSAACWLHAFRSPILRI